MLIICSMALRNTSTKIGPREYIYSPTSLFIALRYGVIWMDPPIGQTAFYYAIAYLRSEGICCWFVETPSESNTDIEVATFAMISLFSFNFYIYRIIQY